jgi:hypothetical protein
VPTAVDDSPNRRSPLTIGFRPPTSLDDPLSSPPLPSPSSSPETDEELAEDLGLGSGDDWDAASSPESPEDTSSPGSTPANDVAALDNEGLRDMARAGVAIAGHQAHQHIAREGGQKQVGLYLTDEEDQAGIGDPLARIAARHQGIGKVSPDTQDLLAALVSIARYGTKQITLAKHAKGIDLAGAGTPQPMPEAVDL